MIKKRYRLLLAAVLLLFGPFAGQAAAATDTISVQYAPIAYFFDEEQMAPPEDQLGFLYKNSVYLPLRFVVQSLELGVSWDNKSRAATIRSPYPGEYAGIERYNEESRLRALRLSEMDQPPAIVKSVRVASLAVTYDVFGEKIASGEGQEAFMINNRLFVPLRFLAETIGYPVHWEQATKSVHIAMPALEEPKADELVPEVEAKPEEEQEEQPPHATVPLPDGGAVVPAPQKPTYESIIRQAEAEFAALEQQCEARLHRLLDEYDASLSADEIKALIQRGEAEVAACDQEFEIIAGQLFNQLDEYGYDTGVVNQYRTEYNAIKEAVRSMLGL